MTPDTEYRGFRVVGDQTFGHKLIKQRGSGDIPAVLHGTYTSATVAQNAIDKYLDTPNTKAKGKVQDGKVNGSV